jgi:hypothetical protein
MALAQYNSMSLCFVSPLGPFLFLKGFEKENLGWREIEK